MVGTRTVTGNNITAGLRVGLVGRLTGRVAALTAQNDPAEVAELARTNVPQCLDGDSRERYLEQYRELTANPVRWVRLT